MYHLSSSINILTIHYHSLILFLDTYFMHGKKYTQYIVETLVLRINGKAKFEILIFFGLKVQHTHVSISVTIMYFIFIFIKSYGALPFLPFQISCF